nr:MAG TPA: NUMOD3 motif protein [Caudoviricetes sp.]
MQKCSEDTRKKMSESRSGEKNGMYGRHRTEEEKENLRKK